MTITRISGMPKDTSTPASPGFIFIDANQYLTLYNVIEGKKLLPALLEQQAHIFVTAQVVDEVQRKKFDIAKKFFQGNFEFLRMIDKFNKPDLLFDVSPETTLKVKNVAAPIAKSNVETVFKSAIAETLDRISRSIDHVSVQLDNLFQNAVMQSDEELNRARARKERGNPPGKQKDVLGDQISWEQILGRFKVNPKVWLIIKDIDFFTQHLGRHFLNPLLFRELRSISDPPQCFCFDDLDKGLADFAHRSGVPANKLPKGKEAEKIQAEWATASTEVSAATSIAPSSPEFFKDFYKEFYKVWPGARTIPGGFNLTLQGSPPILLQSDEEKPSTEEK